MDELQQMVKSILRANDVQDEVITAIERYLSKEDTSQPFAGLESEYLQKKYFTEELNMLVSNQIDCMIYTRVLDTGNVSFSSMPTTDFRCHFILC